MGGKSLCRTSALLLNWMKSGLLTAIPKQMLVVINGLIVQREGISSPCFHL